MTQTQTQLIVVDYKNMTPARSTFRKAPGSAVVSTAPAAVALKFDRLRPFVDGTSAVFRSPHRVKSGVSSGPHFSEHIQYYRRVPPWSCLFIFVSFSKFFCAG